MLTHNCDFYVQFFLFSQARLSSGHIAPFHHLGHFDLPWVPPGPGAHLLRDVDALLNWLKEGDKLGDMLALLLGLQVAGFLRNLSDICSALLCFLETCL